jgi:hypothetical protein
VFREDNLTIKGGPNSGPRQSLPGMAREAVVLDPHTGVGVPVVSWHVGRSAKVRRERHVTDALAKGPWTSLVRGPAAVAVVVAVMAPPAPAVVVVA